MRDVNSELPTETHVRLASMPARNKRVPSERDIKALQINYIIEKLEDLYEFQHSYLYNLSLAREYLKKSEIETAASILEVIFP